MDNSIEKKCVQFGLRMTEQRKIIARVLSASDDHPDAEELYRRTSKINKNISLATVYRTLKLFNDNGILEKHEFKDGKSRYETIPANHHDHLIDIKTGSVIEFHDEEIEKLQERIAEKLGYNIINHRLEIYAVKKSDDKNS
ncbi:MAG: transcriptional repressor [Rhizobiales bacterium]|jgi:Fur family ferric uptake transcriptional regulator|nr:transcriptional repressor [Hyphomicrobiales bacterium]MBL6770878.1 transcriptional repressor [Hyphomicrobiales bacterium]